MKWLRALAPIVAALGLVWIIAGAGPYAQPVATSLIQVLDMTPRAVEPGDTIAILGEGFPAGKPARVTFRGVLHRPGERPITGAEISATGATVSADQIQLFVGDPTVGLFCGGGGRATHATFEGDVEVAFAAAMPGAPPVAGVLSGVTLDVRPLARAADMDRDREGERVLAFLGIRVAASMTTRSGLLVESVGAGSRAERSGIGAGDVLLSFDGVRVGSTGDVLPAAGDREAVVGVRHGASTSELPRTVSVDGFLRAPPAGLFGSALAVLAALAVVVILGAPLRAQLEATIQRAVSRLRDHSATVPGARASIWARMARAMSGVANDALPPSGATAIADAVACALLLAMPFGQYLVAAKLDVGLLFVAATTALAAAVLVWSGSANGTSPALHERGRNLILGLRAAAHVVWQHLPAAAAVASVVMTTGSLRVQEIEHAQGGWPWDWLAFRSPGALIALALLLACARIQPDDDGMSAPARRGQNLSGSHAGSALASALLDAAADRRPQATNAWGLRAASRAHRVVVAGLASVLFLGGWLLPGLSPAQQDAHPVLELAGAVWLLAKTWAIVFVLEAARRALPRRRLAERTRTTALWLLPLSLVSLAASAAWAWCSPAALAQLLVSASLVAIAGLAAIGLVVRVRHGLVSTGGDGRVSPFL
jgi:NADH-quinone oxidoreductase subunit H